MAARQDKMGLIRRPSDSIGVRGIGLALFAYLPMRCGADGIKPDLRVRDGLNGAGLSVTNGAHSIFVVATAVATELDVALQVLDQLLWWQNGS